MNRWRSLGLLIFGVALFALALHLADPQAAWRSVRSVGWGFILVAVAYLPALVADALAWRALFPIRPRIRDALRWRWFSQSVNGLLPAAQVGGDLVRIRFAVKAGYPLAQASATVMGDLVIGLITQSVFAALGLAALVLVKHPLEAQAGPAIVVTGLVVAGIVIGTYLLINRGAMTRLGNAMVQRSSGLFAKLAGGLREIEAQLASIIRDRPALGWASIWRFLGWAFGAIEVWIGFYLLGYPITWAEAFFVESLLQAARSMAFFVPGALGVQESALMGLAAMIGVPADAGLALSLLKRARELTIGLPALAVWQLVEMRDANRAPR